MCVYVCVFESGLFLKLCRCTKCHSQILILFIGIVALQSAVHEYLCTVHLMLK